MSEEIDRRVLPDPMRISGVRPLSEMLPVDTYTAGPWVVFHVSNEGHICSVDPILEEAADALDDIEITYKGSTAI